jgi:hypothetical protein
MRQSGQEPREGEQAVGRGQRAGRVADGEGHHQGDQQGATRELRAKDGKHRSADHHAHGVRRDDVAGARDRDVHAPGDLRKQTHGHELGRADGESAHRQGQHGQPEMGTRLRLLGGLVDRGCRHDAHNDKSDDCIPRNRRA